MPRESDGQDETPEAWDLEDAAEWSRQQEAMTPPPELSDEEQRHRQRMPWFILGILILLAVFVTYATCAGDPRPSMTTLRGVYDLVPVEPMRDDGEAPTGGGGESSVMPGGRPGPCRLVMELSRGGRGRFLWSADLDVDPLAEATGEAEFEWSLDSAGGTLEIFNVGGGMPHDCTFHLAWRHRIVMEDEHVTLYGERMIPQRGRRPGRFLRRTGR